MRSWSERIVPTALAAGGALVILAPVTASLDLKLAASLLLVFGGLAACGIFLFLKSPDLPTLKINRTFLLFCLAYLACLLLSWYFSTYPATAWGDIFPQTAWMLCGLAAASFPLAVEGRRLVLKFWILAACLAALYALFQRLGMDPVAVYAQAGSHERAMSVFGNPTFLAAFLVMVWPMAMYVILRRGAQLCAPTVLGCTAIIVFWAALGATQSRAGLLALGAQLAILTILSRKKTLIVIAGVALAAWLFLPASMWTRPTLRLPLWQATWDMILRHPLLGWGPGSFVLGFSENLAPVLRQAMADSNQFAEHPHNFILSLLWDGGFLLLASFGAVLFYAVQQGWRKVQSHLDHETSLWNAVLLLGLAGLLFQNLFDRNLKLAGSGFFMWVFLGWLSGGQKTDGEMGRWGGRWKRFAGILMILFGSAGLLQAAKPVWAYFAVKSQPDVLAQGREKASENEQQIREALKTAPSDPSLWRALGDALASQSEFGEAGRAYEKCVALDPKAFGALLNLGNCRFQTGDLAGAAKTFERAVKLDPQSVDAHFNLGYAFYYQRRMKEAVAEFDFVLKLQPGHAKALVMKEQILQ